MIAVVVAVGLAKVWMGGGGYIGLFRGRGSGYSFG